MAFNERCICLNGLLLDIVECMATSDNVIRAGLTPKLRDIPNLVGGLTYTAADHRKHLVSPASFQPSSHTTLYNPPIPEFSVLRVTLATGQDEEHRQIDGPSIAIVTEGSGVLSWKNGASLDVSEGEVVFLGANTPLKVEASKGADLVIYRAFVEAN